MKLPKFLYSKLKNHNTSLGDNQAFPPEKEFKYDYYLIKKRYNHIMEKFNNSDLHNLNNSELLSLLSTLITKCKKLEEPIRDNLTKLCEKIVTELFNIPNETIVLECTITDKIKPKHSFRILPEDSDNRDYQFDDLNDYDNLTKVVLKRRLINSLIQGISYEFSSVKYFLHEIYELNPELLPIYEKIRLINDYLLFNVQEKISDKNPMQGSYVEVELGSKGEKTHISSQGIIFPYLLAETVRGLFELFASHGLPNDNKKAMYIIKQADFLIAEPWDLRFGVGLWNIIGNNINDTKILPYYFMHICEMKVDEFNMNLKEILALTKLGDKIKKELLNSSIEDLKYSDNISSIEGNDNKSVIEDQYITEENIDDIDNDYFYDLIKNCSTNNIDFKEEQINDYQFQMHVTIDNIELPENIINLKAEPREINNEYLYQLHIFINPNYQHIGLGYKIYKRFIELFGNIYSGNGRRLNNEEIISILKKLNKEENINVFVIKNANGKNIGYEAKLID